MSEGILVNKFTLSSGKVIYLRDCTVGDLETIAKIAGKEAGSDNQALLAIVMQRESLKQLLVQIDDTKITGPININKEFSFRDFKQAVKAVSMITGEEDEGKELQVSLVTL